MTSSSTITFAGAVRPVGGGTRGGLVRMALTGSPCGGPKSPGEAAAGATVAADAPNILLTGAFPVRSHPDRATALPSSSARAMRCIHSSFWTSGAVGFAHPTMRAVDGDRADLRQ